VSAYFILKAGPHKNKSICFYFSFSYNDCGKSRPADHSKISVRIIALRIDLKSLGLSCA
jgi:hypothetical protein